MSEQDIFQSYMVSISKYKVLEDAESRELITKFQNGCEKSKKKLIQHNLKLVVTIARRYEKFDNQKLMDLISEGNFGLIRAIEKFSLDATSEATGQSIKFSTYAYRWIQFKIEQYFSSSIQAAHCPTHISKLARKISKIESKLDYMNFEGSILNEIQRELEISGESLSISEISSLREISKSSLSLDYTDEDSDEPTLKNMFASHEDVEEIESFKDLNKWVQLKINSLPENQRVAVRSYFGGGEIEGSTMKAVGEEMGFTPQRVQQIVAEGLKALQRMARKENIDESMIGC